MCVKVVKTFFSARIYFSSSQNLYQELGYVPHRGSLLIVWALRMLHAVGICADIMVVRLCAAHTLVCTCAHVYALPCELADRCSSPPSCYFLNLAGIHCVTPCTPLSAYLSANCSKRMSDQTGSTAMRLRGCMSAQTLQEHVCTCNVYNISNVSIFPSSSAVALP